MSERPAPTADDVEPVKHETLDRIATGAVTVIPFLTHRAVATWHNNHHAFPTSAVHGLRWYQIDISALVISAMEKVGLVWDVVRVSPERQARKAASPA